VRAITCYTAICYGWRFSVFSRAVRCAPASTGFVPAAAPSTQHAQPTQSSRPEFARIWPDNPVDPSKRPSRVNFREFSPQCGPIPALRTADRRRNRLSHHDLRARITVKRRRFPPCGSPPLTSVNRVEPCRFCGRSTATTRPHGTKTPRIGGRWSDCAGPCGSVVRNEGVGSNLRMETNMPVARHSLPFRLPALTRSNQ